jgi:magnesium transporter
MINIYRSSEAGLKAIPRPRPDCWVNLVDPTPAEIELTERALRVPHDLLTPALDPDELPRMERNGGHTLILLRVPNAPPPPAEIPHITLPLGILLGPRGVVTICRAEVGVIRELLSAPGLSPAKRVRFLLHALFATSRRFLSHLREINRSVDTLEDRLEASLRNRELLQLLKYQKSLVLFTTALKANEILLRKLERAKTFDAFPEDADLLDDVLTEVQQAIEMTNISSNILSQMMDAFASIISNNLNVVMKVLTSATIILAVPAVFGTFFGMNVPLPFSAIHPASFWVILTLAVAAAGVVLVVFWRKDWL